MSFISTGALPPADAIVRALDTVHDEVRPVTDGVNSPVYPMLASADPDQFGLSLVGVDGSVHER